MHNLLANLVTHLFLSESPFTHLELNFTENTASNATKLEKWVFAIIIFAFLWLIVKKLSREFCAAKLDFYRFL